MVRRDGFYVIGSGAGIRFEADGSMRLQVNTIGQEPDENKNVEADVRWEQVRPFLRWLSKRAAFKNAVGEGSTPSVGKGYCEVRINGPFVDVAMLHEGEWTVQGLNLAEARNLIILLQGALRIVEGEGAARG